MSGTYFDAVLDRDSMKSVFNGTPEETVKWLQEDADKYNEIYEVCVGRTLGLVPVWKYLKEAKICAVLELVREAILAGDPNAYAHKIAIQIVELD